MPLPQALLLWFSSLTSFLYVSYRNDIAALRTGASGMHLTLLLLHCALRKHLHLLVTGFIPPILHRPLVNPTDAELICDFLGTRTDRAALPVP